MATVAASPAGRRTSGGGAILGAILGAAIGHQVGDGTGRKVATGAGAIGGAVIGNNVGDGNAGRGAVIGGAVGAAAGAARGYGQDQKINDCRAVSRDQRTYRDYNTGDYYYEVPGTNRTCWTDGRPRS